VLAASISDPQAPGPASTSTFAFVSTDSTNPDIVYVAYQNLLATTILRPALHRRGVTGRRCSNEDPGAGQQIFPTIDVSGGVDGLVRYPQQCTRRL
jgi:hypothetical protein